MLLSYCTFLEVSFQTNPNFDIFLRWDLLLSMDGFRWFGMGLALERSLRHLCAIPRDCLRSPAFCAATEAWELICCL